MVWIVLIVEIGLLFVACGSFVRCLLFIGCVFFVCVFFLCVFLSICFGSNKGVLGSLLPYQYLIFVEEKAVYFCRLGRRSLLSQLLFCSF